jgi:hypothetical protein
MYPLIVVAEISLQLHRSLFLLFLEAFGVWMYGCLVESEQFLCSIDVGQFSLHRIEGKKHVCASSLSLGAIVLHSLMRSTLCLQALSSWLNLQFTEDYPNEGRDGRRVSSPPNTFLGGKEPTTNQSSRSRWECYIVESKGRQGNLRIDAPRRCNSWSNFS